MTQAATSSTSAGGQVAQHAKAALRRLVVEKLEPTPENYAHAFRIESGGTRTPALPAPAMALFRRLLARAIGPGDDTRMRDIAEAVSSGQWERAESLCGSVVASTPGGLAETIESLMRGLERGSRHWTIARRRESLQRLLASGRSDGTRLQTRIVQLLARWEADAPDATVELNAAAAGSPPAAIPHADAAQEAHEVDAARAAQHAHELTASVAIPGSGDHDAWLRLIELLAGALRQALPQSDAEGRVLAQALADSLGRVQTGDVDAALVEAVAEHCRGGVRVLEHRHHLVEMLGTLCAELSASLSELAEEDSWARGQTEAMRNLLEGGITARAVKSVSELLRTTRSRQAQLRADRVQARDTLKAVLHQMLSELAELGVQTGRFQDNMGRHAEVIARADSIESLSGVVREIVKDSRTVQTLVAQAQQRLHDEHAKASDLTVRVNQLEDELLRLSNEVSTDQLTQVANRRGLYAIFERECQRLRRTGRTLSIGLLDIDNFKRLNDELGHSAGDVALKSLASLVSDNLRPDDTVARYGGEEFVVLLPATEVDEAQALLTRLQRSLSGGLFLHEQKNVMVTFSAGVTAYREPEPIADALERADQALYEAKRNGKNRTCTS